MSERAGSWRRAILATAVVSATLVALQATSADAAPHASDVAPLDQSEHDPPFGAFLGPCNKDSDCNGGNTCTSFRRRGNRCTHACKTASDCGPAARCTGQNRCGLN